MNITKFVETTEPITIQRGEITLKLDCYLEKISSENNEYVDLEGKEREIRRGYAMNKGKLDLLLDSNYWLYQLGAPDENGETPTREKAEERAKEMEAEAAKLAKKIKATEAELFRNYAQRIAYLVRAWDITEGADDTPLPVTAANIQKYFSRVIIEQIVQTIEGAVFGPLAATPPASTA